MKRITIIVFLMIVLFFPKTTYCFKPWFRDYYTPKQRGDASLRRTPEGKKKAVYRAKLETDKKYYVKGEPVLYMISVSPVNNYNGYFRGKFVFTLKNGNTIIKSKEIMDHEPLWKFAGITGKYIILPVSAGNIFSPPNFRHKDYISKKGRVMNMNRHIYRLSPYEVMSYRVKSYANIFTYFSDSTLQTDIKPGRYTLKVEFIKDNDRYSTILSDSAVFEIKPVPDSEKVAFGLLRHKKYEEIVSRYPNSVYAPYSSFEGLVNKLKAYYRLPESERTEKKREEIEDGLYNGVRDYPEYYAGEVEVTGDIFYDVIYVSFFNREINEKTERYFNRYRKIEKNNIMARFMVKFWIKHYEFIYKWTKERMKRNRRIRIMREKALNQN